MPSKVRILEGHHRGQPLSVIENAHGLQMLTGLGHPHDHRPPAMQINTDDLLSCVLFAHRGLLRRGGREHPESASGRSRGAEAPLLHRISSGTLDVVVAQSGAVDPATVRLQARKNRKLSPAEVVELVDAYKAGASQRELTRRFGLHEQTVRAQ